MAALMIFWRRKDRGTDKQQRETAPIDTLRPHDTVAR